MREGTGREQINRLHGSPPRKDLILLRNNSSLACVLSRYTLATVDFVADTVDFVANTIDFVAESVARMYLTTLSPGCTVRGQSHTHAVDFVARVYCTGPKPHPRGRLSTKSTVLNSTLSPVCTGL